MMRRRVDFDSLPSIRQYAWAVLDVIREARDQRDRDLLTAAVGALAEVMAGFRRFLQRSMRRRPSLGGEAVPDLGHMGADELLAYLEETVCLYEALIEAKQDSLRGARTARQKQLSGEIRKLIATLRRIVRYVRSRILSLAPDRWTEKETVQYRRFLS